VNDLPCSGRTLTIDITAQRFRCGNPACSRSIFCERLPAFGSGILVPESANAAAVSAAAGSALLRGELRPRIGFQEAAPRTPESAHRDVLVRLDLRAPLE
jgi:hypothetical protein